jgi:hypothetical protein
MSRRPAADQFPPDTNQSLDRRDRQSPDGELGFLPVNSSSELPKSSAGASGGLTSAFNFRASATILITQPKLTHGNYGECAGRTATCVMISEVLFGYFSRSWIPLIGGIQRAELFKEKVTDASQVDHDASQFYLSPVSGVRQKVRSRPRLMSGSGIQETNTADKFPPDTNQFS